MRKALRVGTKRGIGRAFISGALATQKLRKSRFSPLSVDCAFKDLATSDYVAIIVIGVKGRKRFILVVVNEHLDAATR